MSNRQNIRAISFLKAHHKIHTSVYLCQATEYVTKLRHCLIFYTKIFINVLILLQSLIPHTTKRTSIIQTYSVLNVTVCPPSMCHLSRES